MRRRWVGERVRRWGPVVAWLLVITAFSTGWFSGEQTGYVLLPLFRWLLPSASYAELVALHHAARKLAHFGEYLVLAPLIYRALDGMVFSPRIAARALALAALCALADEVHQSFVATRTSALLDVVIDASGAAAGLGLVAARARLFMARVPARP